MLGAFYLRFAMLQVFRARMSFETGVTVDMHLARLEWQGEIGHQ